jgi:Protein of unknown function (DUF2489)
MANPDKRTSSLPKLVSAARAIVTYQTSLPLGCMRVQRTMFWLPDEQRHYAVFAEFLAAIRELPVGTERLQWDREALRARDVELERILRGYRDRVFEACYDIIDRYATPTEQTTKVI